MSNWLFHSFMHFFAQASITRIQDGWFRVDNLLINLCLWHRLEVAAKMQSVRSIALLFLIINGINRRCRSILMMIPSVQIRRSLNTISWIHILSFFVPVFHSSFIFNFNFLQFICNIAIINFSWWHNFHASFIFIFISYIFHDAFGPDQEQNENDSA